MFWRLAYELIARRLPRSDRPVVGWISNYIRFMCIKRFVKSCGSNLKIGPNVSLSTSSVIGNNVTINENCNLQGCEIGDYALIAPECYVVTRNHRYDQDIPVILQGYEKEFFPKIGSNVWIGIRVTILPGVNIGDNAVVGACAVLTRDVPAEAVVAGVPAKIIRYRKGGINES